jgi:hypothetical protein
MPIEPINLSRFHLQSYQAWVPKNIHASKQLSKESDEFLERLHFSIEAELRERAYMRQDEMDFS